MFQRACRARTWYVGAFAGPPGPLPASHPLLQPRQVVSDADAGAAALAGLLRPRPPGADQLQGALKVVLAKAAGHLAKQRPRLMGRLLPPLLAFAKRSAAEVQVQTPMAS